MTGDINCPYCDAELNICHDDGQGFKEDVAYEMECSECEKNFVYYTSISYSYSSHKADCLNGQPHNLKVLHDCKNCTIYNCVDCDFDKYDWKEPTQ